jgi:FKBP-type peptidyl-prolyl cis-trans isomerase FkpA
MNAIAHSSGLYYEIVTPGSGATASANSTIYITYVGKFLDGSTFDQQSNPGATGWPLSQLIEGWRTGIPLIQEGGRIKLIVPSAMAYGCTGYAAIPGNTVLFFDITLTDVQ